MLQDPGNREPAPEPLRLVQAFVNTLDIENGVEELERPAQLRELLVRLEVLQEGEPVTDLDLRRAVEFREALRELLLANNGGRVEPESVDVLERAARAAHLSVRFAGATEADLEPQAPAVDGALGRIVAVAFKAMADGSWERLKACRRDVCYWVFYDRSRNRSSHWCAMSVCGNRTKTKVYRHRRGRAKHADA